MTALLRWVALAAPVGKVARAAEAGVGGGAAEAGAGAAAGAASEVQNRYVIAKPRTVPFKISGSHVASEPCETPPLARYLRVRDGYDEATVMHAR